MFNDQSPNPCEKYMNIPWKMGSAPAANSKIQAWARARKKSPVAHNKYIQRLDEKYMSGHARACRRSCPVFYTILNYTILIRVGGGPTAYFIPGRVGWGVGPRQIVVCMSSVVCLSVCHPPPRPKRDPPATHPNRWSNNTNNNNDLLV